MGDRRGDVDSTLGMAASDYRNFTPFTGASNPLYGTNDIIEANIQDDAPISQRWLSMLDETNYLRAFGGGGEHHCQEMRSGFTLREWSLI